jgi:hypothetical protein
MMKNQKITIKKKKQINKKNKLWGVMKHRKGETIIFCEEDEVENASKQKFY